MRSRPCAAGRTRIPTEAGRARPGRRLAAAGSGTIGRLRLGAFDVAIRRGVASEGAWPGYRAIPVLEDVDILIMSPAPFAQHPIRAPADIEGHVLLANETRPGDWVDWLEAAGLSHLAERPRRVFDHFFITRQVVEDGLGIGIGPLPLLEIDVASGGGAGPGSFRTTVDLVPGLAIGRRWR